jgi:hypothetical protein
MEFSCFLGIIDYFGVLQAVFVQTASLALRYQGKHIFAVEEVRAIDLKDGETNKNYSDALTKVRVSNSVNGQEFLLQLQPQHHAAADCGA